MNQTSLPNRFHINEVFFMRPTPQWGLVRVFEAGAERVALLRTLYHRPADLGELVPFVLGYGEVKRDDIDWTTAGRLVTDKGEEQ